MEYTIIWAASYQLLARRVNEEIAAGWIPLGGVAATVQPQLEIVTYCQAMTRELAAPEPPAHRGRPLAEHLPDPDADIDIPF